MKTVLTKFTATDVSSATAAVTTIWVWAVTVPETAVITAVPADNVVMTPVLLTMATAVLLELNTRPEVSTAVAPVL